MSVREEVIRYCSLPETPEKSAIDTMYLSGIMTIEQFEVAVLKYLKELGKEAAVTARKEA